MYQEPVGKKWYPAKITKLCDEPRSYIITIEEGTQYRRTHTLKAIPTVVPDNQTRTEIK